MTIKLLTATAIAAALIVAPAAFAQNTMAPAKPAAANTMAAAKPMATNTMAPEKAAAPAKKTTKKHKKAKASAMAPAAKTDAMAPMANNTMKK